MTYAQPSGARPNVPPGRTLERTNRFLYALQIGLAAGVIFGGIRWICWLFRFTKVLPGFLAEPFFLHDFLAGTGGHFVGWGFFTLLSLAAALLYAPAASFLRGPWPAALYGAAWFGVLYLWIGPMFGMMEPVGRLNWDSLWTDFSVFTVWGLFIGYSLSYEFSDNSAFSSSGKLW